MTTMYERDSDSLNMYIPAHHRRSFQVAQTRSWYTCDLDLDPMTFIHELDPYLLKM